MALDLQVYGKEAHEGWGPRGVILNKNISIVYINYIYKSTTDRDKILTFMKNTICDFLKTKILRKGT